ncbi:hypothetical protein QR680_003261 [Steinernema hermaphroditum]|uniref:Uncharacterized protein n=1 Tax=Steinernema hermaphroditum TaxID=289476 RepID=A0AA39H608_9BILA|nr:hypothetical protein QR680_003261 [Steinernema hermaphroditum]
MTADLFSCVLNITFYGRKIFAGGLPQMSLREADPDNLEAPPGPVIFLTKEDCPPPSNNILFKDVLCNKFFVCNM